MFFVDTCVVIQGTKYGHGSCSTIVKHMFGNNTNPVIALTDFTLAEIGLRAEHKTKRAVEGAVHSGSIPLYVTGIKPGEWSDEKQYEHFIDSRLSCLVPDPSDAVLVAAAERFNAEGIITRDRHDIYTTRLFNYLEQKGILLFKPGEFEERYLHHTHL
ncbi:MAG: hypothetical protein J7K68_05540 [Candidatus Diapherotrites archaeon]|nr:hypothetical protein [Candidatus Diapherotrites archaeon]